MASTLKYPVNKLWTLNVLVTLLWLVLVARVVFLFQVSKTQDIVELLEIGGLFMAMIPRSVQLPSGAAWRPAMPLVMISIFVLPPGLTTVVAIPGLILSTVRAHSPWWKYPQTFAHVGLGLYVSSLVFRALTKTLGTHIAGLLIAMIVSLVVHLIINRSISALIVAEQRGRAWSEQLRLTIRELHLGYLNSYLIVIMTALLFREYGAITLLIAAIAQVALMEAIAYYSSARQFEQAAGLDGLTGIENRVAWDKLVRMSTTPLSVGTVMVIDIDNFKSVNDQFGHLIGDTILQNLAEAMSHSLPTRARIFRYGGDEFVVFDVSQSRSTDLLFQLNSAVRSCNQDWQNKGIEVSVSMGSAVAGDDGDNPLDLFSVADARMYENKHRHRITFEGMEVGLSEIVIGLIAATEARDKYTAGHNLRVAFYALELAKHFHLESQKLKAIFRGSIVHDIGKIGIPDALLSKPGVLTPDERLIVETHPQIGYDMCVQLGFSTDELTVIRHHHEKWDGSGYPDGLIAEDIPLLARIVALADIYDALTSDRAYRTSWTHEKAMAYIEDNSGLLFDPDCVRAWLTSNLDGPLIERQPPWLVDGGIARVMAGRS